MGMVRTFTAMMFAVAVFTLAPAAAEAGNVTKRQITSILSEQGYAVRDFDERMVAVVVGDHVVLVAIDGADGDISYITYINGVSVKLLGYEFLSQFNSEVKFGRAYVDQDGDIALQMDRNAAGGVSAENIESDFDVFLILIAKFLSDVENISIT
ncbi:MAG: YbjN domain-containing protein [Pseudomonadota bacterium]